MSASRETLSQQFRSREPLFAGWTSWGHPSITEVFAKIGLDFIGIDIEHSTIHQEQALVLIAAAQAAGTACLPRVASHNGEQIRRLLDSGADGIIVPNVAHPEEVKQLVDWCKYPPVGQRSFGVARAQGYGFDFQEYVESWNRRSALILQIESVAGVEAVDSLLAHDAVDGAMVGPYDLSGSLGIPGQLSHPRVTEACARVVEACRKRKKGCGTQVVDPDPDNVAACFRAGYTFVVLASDVFLLWKWSQRMKELIAQVGAGVQHAQSR